MTFEEATKQANKLSKIAKVYYTAVIEPSVTGDRTRSWFVSAKFNKVKSYYKVGEQNV